jgi:acyl carrier protein
VESLRAHLTPLLPDYMVPSAFVVLDRLPLSPNGKLDRRAFPAPEIGAYSTREYEPPQGWTETLLSQTWQTVLGVERVGRRDNFFELGGHSLLAMQVIVRIRSWLSLEIPIRWLFELPTVEQLSPQLDRLRQADLPGVPDNDAEDVEDLLEAIASMSESEVRKRVQELEMGERS